MLEGPRWLLGDRQGAVNSAGRPGPVPPACASWEQPSSEVRPTGKTVHQDLQGMSVLP